MSLGVRLATYGKWTERHGYDTDESQEIINFMKKKNILYYDQYSENRMMDRDNEPPDELNTIEDINYLKWLHEACPFQYELGIIKISYVFNDRLFGVKHFGIEKFQKKWREYYKKKLMFKKSLKNLRYREIYGKYPSIL